jgi:hypothetical protein
MSAIFHDILPERRWSLVPGVKIELRLLVVLVVSAAFAPSIDTFACWIVEFLNNFLKLLAAFMPLLDVYAHIAYICDSTFI